MSPAEMLGAAKEAGLSVSITASGELFVVPAARMAPALRDLLVTNRTAVLEHLQHAANDSGANVSDWLERHRVQLHDDVTPGALEKFAAASVALDRQLAEAGAADDKPDCWCWPTDPSIGAAMNAAEIALFERRHARMLALGLVAAQADDLADKLVIRDREGDDRVCCAECLHGRAQACPNVSPLPLAMLHQCALLVPLA